jgi:glutaredoxin
VSPDRGAPRAKRRSAAVDAAVVEVVLYGRPDCHLCDEARALLRDLDGVRLREVDIEGDDRLFKAYLERIPVIEIGGRVVSELVPDADAIRDAVHTVGP